MYVVFFLKRLRFLHDALMFAFIPSSEARLGAFGALPTNRLHHAHLASIGTGQGQSLEHFVIGAKPLQ